MQSVSVVLATYNGSKYIKEQLFSILNQTRRPDEVIIRDDCSTDDTVEVIKKFIRDNCLESEWHLEINQHNKGWVQNFYDMIVASKGDIIFYSDQDDLWYDWKIKEMADFFDKDDSILCLGSRFHAIDSNGEFIDSILKEKIIETGAIRKVGLNDEGFYTTSCGCTLAFKKELKEYFSDGFGLWTADNAIVKTAICLDGMYEWNKYTIEHRFHNNNSGTTLKDGRISAGKRSYDFREKVAINDARQISVLYNKIDGFLREKKLSEEKIFEKFSFEYCRYKSLSTKKIKYIIKSMLFANSIVEIKKVCADMCYIMKINKLIGALYQCLKDIVYRYKVD